MGSFCDIEGMVRVQSLMRMTRRLVDSDEEKSELASTRRIRRTTTRIEKRGSTAQQIGVGRE